MTGSAMMMIMARYVGQRSNENICGKLILRNAARGQREQTEPKGNSKTAKAKKSHGAQTTRRPRLRQV
jgi:hypothetical protein